MLYKLLYLIVFTIFFWNYSSAQKSKNAGSSGEPKFPEAGAFVDKKISYKIINSVNGTFGYDILSEGKLLIHQPSIPGMPGNLGFKSKSSAEKVAQLVVKKIHNGEMPPSVSIEEMKKLKAIN